MLTRVANASRVAVTRRAAKQSVAVSRRAYAGSGIAGSGTVFEDREHALENRAARDHDSKLIEQLKAELAVRRRDPIFLLIFWVAPRGLIFDAALSFLKQNHTSNFHFCHRLCLESICRVCGAFFSGLNFFQNSVERSSDILSLCPRNL
jgi:hypothetical protein